MSKKKIKEQKKIQLWYGCKKCKVETTQDKAKCPKCNQRLSINFK